MEGRVLLGKDQGRGKRVWGTNLGVGGNTVGFAKGGEGEIVEYLGKEVPSLNECRGKNKVRRHSQSKNERGKK